MGLNGQDLGNSCDINFGCELVFVDKRNAHILDRIFLIVGVRIIEFLSKIGVGGNNSFL